MTLLLNSEYSAFENGYNGSGVYALVGTQPSESFERPIYFGSSTNLRKRILHAHILQLRANKHNNKPLQNYFNKHGAANLSVFLVEETTKDATIHREQYYLDTEQPFADVGRGFNISRVAESPNRGKSPSEATRAKMSIASKGRGKGVPKSQEVKDKLSKALKGRPGNPNAIAKSSKPFALIAPDGTRHTGNNLKGFAALHGLNYSPLWAVARGKTKSSQGWRAA